MPPASPLAKVAAVSQPTGGSSPGRLDGPIVNAYWAGPEVVILRRVGPERELVKQTVPAEHACFLPKANVTAKHLRELRGARSIAGVREDGAHWRVTFHQRRMAQRAAEKDSWFAQEKIPVLEADVDPVRRWLTDTDVEIDKPRRAYVDLETDSRVPFSRGEEARILCWSLVDHDGARTGMLLEEDTDDAERALLRAMFRELRPYDVVLAWNGDRFDFVRIGARVGKLGIGMELRRWLWLDHMRLFNKMNASAAESGDEKQFAGLESVAKAVLGADEEKLVHLGQLGGPTTWSMWEAGGEQRASLLEYCIDDADKMRKIEDRTGYVDLLETLCQSTHTLPDSRGMLPTRYVEGFLLRLGASRGMRFASRVWEENAPGGEEQEQFKGAFVLEPTKLGIVRDVHVCDFARLYPSIIMSWNMSPETRLEDFWLVEKAEHRPSYLRHLPETRKPIPAGCCAAALTDVVFRNEPVGILAEGVGEMLRLRKHWDDLKKSFPPGTPEWKEADRRSAAYKIAANAFYGVIGSPFSRFFVREVAESVAQTGAWLILETIKAVEARGWRAIYADTDSAFVVGCDREEFGRFVEWCDKELYPKLLAGLGCARNRISLAYEKAFRVLVMVGKKRYAGRYLHFKGKDATADSKPEVKGLEIKRGDSSRLARRMQEEVVKLMLDGVEDLAEYEGVVARCRDHVLNDRLEHQDVVLSKRLSKPLREYVRTRKKDGDWARQPPHVELARELAEKGRDVGAGVRIEYVVVDDASDPPKYVSAEDWNPGAEFDRHYLWESMVYPPTMRVLEVVFKHGGWKRWERTRPPKAPRGADGAGDLFKARDLPKARDVAKAAPPAKQKVAPAPELDDRRWKQKTLF